ncbi:hypothetical protein [Dokdonella sp.]|uniref:hypothetical protein n=1 Tax=Dokdonella sp. TaxID=2291710 RepID=UPI0025C2E72D|nr:hypothetical protein [Dokdonella sp.]MBX3690590.1 hypothetical protein [Dokdonella sp.]
MLAIARFVDTPMQYFVADHIPGSTYYRPVGMLVWWLTERVFGTSAALHYTFNLALHAAVGVLLLRVLARAGLRTGLSFLLALTFTLHPVSIGTTAWLSDRFDLLAALFGLLALRAGMLHAGSRRTSDGIVALMSLALALLSKEIAYSFAAALFAWWMLGGREDWPERRRWLFALVVLVLACAVLRGFVIADAGAAKMLKHRSLVETFALGMHGWFQGSLAHLGYWERLGEWKRFTLVIGLAMLCAASLFAMSMPWPRARVRLALVGAILFALPGLLQVPLLAVVDLRVGLATETVLLVINSRYFYTAAIGLVLLLAAVLMPITQSRPAFRAAAAVAMILLAVSWVGAAQRLTVQHRDETRRQGERVAAANAAIARAVLPQPCRIFLLGTDDWTFHWISDEAIKGSIADADFARVSACLIQTEHVPWYHIVPRGSVDVSRLAPLALARGLEGIESRLRLGSAETISLTFKTGIDARDIRDALFLAWRDGEFVDVGSEVEQGLLSVDFVCNRECVP